MSADKKDCDCPACRVGGLQELTDTLRTAQRDGTNPFAALFSKLTGLEPAEVSRRKAETEKVMELLKDITFSNAGVTVSSAMYDEMIYDVRNILRTYSLPVHVDGPPVEQVGRSAPVVTNGPRGRS